ncbi:uncharacterized protein TNCV_1514801 [Trichonephila clavipes]|nr:uncharacterized protein TNCV_1514801 [Trichonephila clavipes]
MIPAETLYFSLGQLYVACSRAGKPDNLYIYTENGKTKNVAYPEAWLENGADDLNLKNEILIRLQRIEELIVDFERLDSELSAEESEIMEFEQRYFDLKLKFQDKIDAIDASRSINVSGQNISIAIPTEQSKKLIFDYRN